MITRSTRTWWVLTLRSMIAVLFGLAALIWPGTTLTALALLFGAYALVDGVRALIASLRQHDRQRFDHWWILLLKGLVGIAIGGLTFLWASVTTLALLERIVAWAILTGVLEVVAAVELRHVVEGRWQLAWGKLIEREMNRSALK